MSKYGIVIGDEEVMTYLAKCFKVLEREIRACLNNAEHLVDFRRSNKRDSYYVTIKNIDTNDYILFRISTHDTTRKFYACKTFLFSEYDDMVDLIIDIRIYLDNIEWNKMNYNKYYVLNMIKLLGEKNNHVYIGDTEAHFNQNIGKMYFYQQNNNGKRFDLPSNVCQIMRELFTHGLLSSFEENNQTLVYVTSASNWLMYTYHREFHHRFEREYYLSNPQKLRLLNIKEEADCLDWLSDILESERYEWICYWQ